METTKAKAFAGETPSKSPRKAREKNIYAQMSLLQNGNLHRITIFDQRGPPAWYLGGGQNTIPCKN